MRESMRRLVITMIALAVLETVISIAIDKGTFGVVLGSIGSLVNLYSLWYDTERMVERGLRVWRTGYLGRYVFNAVLMLLGGLRSLEDLIGVFVGLMNLKVGIYLSFGGWKGE